MADRFAPLDRFAIRRRITSLDPERDHAEIMRLSSGYEFPWDYVRALEETRDTTDLPEASGEAIAREFERYLKRRDDED